MSTKLYNAIEDRTPTMNLSEAVSALRQLKVDTVSNNGDRVVSSYMRKRAYRMGVEYEKYKRLKIEDINDHTRCKVWRIRALVQGQPEMCRTDLELRRMG